MASVLGNQNHDFWSVNITRITQSPFASNMIRNTHDETRSLIVTVIFADHMVFFYEYTVQSTYSMKMCAEFPNCIHFYVVYS